MAPRGELMPFYPELAPIKEIPGQRRECSVGNRE
jgi:hypothetical protein